MSKFILVICLLSLTAKGYGQSSWSMTGRASFYANSFNGRKTACGERFSNDSLTAASLTMPFGSKVKVTNLSNNKSVVVTINDRGPYVHGRILDLSRAAADSLDMIYEGCAMVTIEKWESPEDPLRLPILDHSSLNCITSSQNWIVALLHADYSAPASEINLGSNDGNQSGSNEPEMELCLPPGFSNSREEESELAWQAALCDARD